MAWSSRSPPHAESTDSENPEPARSADAAGPAGIGLPARPRRVVQDPHFWSCDGQGASPGEASCGAPLVAADRHRSSLAGRVPEMVRDTHLWGARVPHPSESPAPVEICTCSFESRHELRKMGVWTHCPSAPRWKAVGMPETTVDIPTAGGELLSAATALADAAEQPGASRVSRRSALIEQALRVVSASVGVLAHDAVPDDAERDALARAGAARLVFVAPLARAGGPPSSNDARACTRHQSQRSLMCTCPRDRGTNARREALKASASGYLLKPGRQPRVLEYLRRHAAINHQRAEHDRRRKPHQHAETEPLPTYGVSTLAGGGGRVGNDRTRQH